MQYWNKAANEVCFFCCCCFSSSHTMSNKANWLAVFASEICFTKITLLLKVMNALSQTCTNTNWLCNNQHKESKASVLSLLITDFLARSFCFKKIASVSMNFFWKPAFFCEVPVNKKPRGFDLTTTSLFIFFSHILWASLKTSALSSGVIPLHFEIQCTPSHLNRSQLNC